MYIEDVFWLILSLCVQILTKIKFFILQGLNICFSCCFEFFSKVYSLVDIFLSCQDLTVFRFFSSLTNISLGMFLIISSLLVSHNQLQHGQCKCQFTQKSWKQLIIHHNIIIKCMKHNLITNSLIVPNIWNIQTLW